jgi:flavin-dependent dehydrogenase
VLEPHALPSDTLSTHFFRGAGLVSALVQVGILDQVLAAGAPRLTAEWFGVDGAEPHKQGPQDPGEPGFCLCVRRVTLDGILAERAAAEGVDFRWGRRVVEVVRDAGGRVVGVRDDAGQEHHARVVVGADGRRSSIARLVGAADVVRHPAARAMYFRYGTGWTGRDHDPAPEFSLVGNELAYAFPCDGGLVCVAVSVPVTAHEAARGDVAGYAMGRLACHPAMAGRLHHVEWSGRVRIGLPADSVLRTAAGPGWALVGDAGTSQDPWAGFGMDTAARQAAAFVECLVDRPDDWWTHYPAARDAVTRDAFDVASRHAPDLRTMLAG